MYRAITVWQATGCLTLRCRFVSADLKGSHSGRYGVSHLASEVRVRKPPRRPLTGGQAVTIASFFLLHRSSAHRYPPVPSAPAGTAESCVCL